MIPCSLMPFFATMALQGNRRGPKSLQIIEQLKNEGAL